MFKKCKFNVLRTGQTCKRCFFFKLKKHEKMNYFFSDFEIFGERFPLRILYGFSGAKKVCLSRGLIKFFISCMNCV